MIMGAKQCFGAKIPPLRWRSGRDDMVVTMVRTELFAKSEFLLHRQNRPAGH